jgi:hypothetical protein
VSEHGKYTLHLVCDSKIHLLTGQASVAITEATRMQAMVTAREAGWMLQHKHRALCPVHATEKRTRRRLRP